MNQLMYFLDLAHFEWPGRSFKDHVKLRKNVFEMYGPGGKHSKNPQLSIWVELCVLKPDDRSHAVWGSAKAARKSLRCPPYFAMPVSGFDLDKVAIPAMILILGCGIITVFPSGRSSDDTSPPMVKYPASEIKRFSVPHNPYGSFGPATFNMPLLTLVRLHKSRHTRLPNNSISILHSRTDSWTPYQQLLLQQSDSFQLEYRFG